MNKTEIRLFVDKLFELDKPFIQISEQLEKYFLKNKSVSYLETQSLIESHIQKIYHEIELKISKHQNEFTISKYNFSSYDKDKLINAYYDAEIEQRNQIKIKLRWREKIKEILRKITWRDFELLAKHILFSNKLISQIEITKSTNDQGIDFWGFIKYKYNIDNNRLTNDLEFRIIGQVKHSSKNVKVNHQKISSFGTELNRLRKKNPPNYFVSIPSSFYQSSLPIVGLFITNTDYLPKAKDFAQEYGIIIWNGNQISEDLANDLFLLDIKKNENEISLENLISMVRNEN